MKRLSFISVYQLFHRCAVTRRRHDTIIVDPLLAGTDSFSLSRERLFPERGNVARLLSQINDSMKQSCNQHPQRWIAARIDWKGRNWNIDLRDVDMLLAMGRALGMVCIFRPEGPFAVCDMPMLQILDRDAARAERMLPLEEQDKRLRSWDYKYLRR